MKITLKDILYLLIIALIIGIWVRTSQNQKDLTLEDVKEYWETQDFKPDTIINNFTYPEIKLPEYPNQVPPKVVIHYEQNHDNGNLLKITDSLLRVINSKDQELAKINKAFLTKHPISPKLVYGEFDVDTIKLDLLNIDGNISRVLYPVNYKRFSYQYHENIFKSLEKDLKVDRNSSKIDPDFFHSFNGIVKYDFVSKNPGLGVNYTLGFRRINLGIEPHIWMSNTLEPRLELRVGYKIF